MQQLLNSGVFDDPTRRTINTNFSQLQAGGFTGNVYYLDPKNGSDNNAGTSAQAAFKTLGQAYGACVSGNNDVVLLMGDGTTGATARLSANFTWSKNATHLMGICSPVPISQRARIAPAAGITAFANFFTVSGNGCLFQNVQFFQGFDTGVAAEICLTVSGQRNAFINCDISGMGDTVGATDAGSRNLKLTAGENYFGHCNIGLDTVARTLANASVESTSGAARNVFEGCIFPMLSTDGLQFFYKAGAAGLDRFVMFKGCSFISAVGSTGTANAAAFNLNAAAGGIIVFDSGSGLYGSTAIGDSTTKGLTYVNGGTATNGVKGIVAT